MKVKSGGGGGGGRGSGRGSRSDGCSRPRWWWEMPGADAGRSGMSTVTKDTAASDHGDGGPTLGHLAWPVRACQAPTSQNAY